MKRAPIVLAGTAAGLIGVVSYPSSSPSSAATLGSSSSTTTQTTSAASATTTQSTAAKAASSTTSTKTKSATGALVNFRYGDLKVKVSMTGTHISDISVVQLDVTDPHSQGIDQAAIPQLLQTAKSAQSAKIHGVSGASYTSAAYEQSLQSALDKLKV